MQAYSHIIYICNYKLNRLQIFSSILFYHTSSIHNNSIIIIRMARDLVLYSSPPSQREHVLPVSCHRPPFWGFFQISFPITILLRCLKTTFFYEARERCPRRVKSIDHWTSIQQKMVFFIFYIRCIKLMYVLALSSSSLLWKDLSKIPSNNNNNNIFGKEFNK